MNAMLATLLTAIETYSYPALWGIVFLAGVGIPLPVDPLLIATGAFAAEGDLNPVTLMLVGTTASVCGDSIGYLIGKLWGKKALRWVSRSHIAIRLLIPARLAQASDYMERYGGWAVFLSRSLAGTLSGPVNLFAGEQLMPYRAFLAYDLLGDAVDVAAMLVLGWIAGAGWQAASDGVRMFSLVACGLLVAAFVAVRWMRRVRRVRHAI